MVFRQIDCESTLADEELRGGEVRDSAYYSVVDDEWPEVKASLLRRLEAKR